MEVTKGVSDRRVLTCLMLHQARIKAIARQDDQVGALSKDALQAICKTTLNLSEANIWACTVVTHQHRFSATS